MAHKNINTLMMFTLIVNDFDFESSMEMQYKETNFHFTSSQSDFPFPDHKIFNKEGFFLLLIRNRDLYSVLKLKFMSVPARSANSVSCGQHPLGSEKTISTMTNILGINCSHSLRCLSPAERGAGYKDSLTSRYF